jgi:hypothetical protein
MKSWRLTIPAFVLILSLVLPGASGLAQTIQVPALPGQPTNVDAHGANMAVVVAWNAPAIGTPTSYKVNIYHLTGGSYQSVSGETVTFNLPTLATVTGLSNAEAYYFNVTPFFGLVPGTTSALSGPVQPGLIGPAPPINLYAGVVGSDVTLTWSRPSFTPVDHYLLFISQSGGSMVRYLDGIPSTDTSVTISGLAAGSYSMQLRTVGTNAMMSISSVAAATIPQFPSRPAPVADVRAVAGNGMVTISWLPASNGGSPITSYTVAYSANSNDVAAVIHPAIDVSMFDGTRWSTPVIGLTNGTTYTFYVFAGNAVGTSQPAISNAVTPTAPGSPTLAATPVTLQPGDQVSLSGKGFAPGTQVSIALGGVNSSASGNYGTAVTDTAGNFSLTVTLSRYPDGSALHAGPIVLVAHTPSWNQNAAVQLQVVTLSTSGTSVRPGSYVTLTGDGFTPGMVLTTSMGGSNFGFAGNYGAVVADSNGHFTLSVLVAQYPDGSPLHADAVVLMVHNADWSQKASVQIQVLSNPSMVANVTTIKSGDSVVLTGSGFTPGKLITIGMSVNAILGGNYATVLADSSGRFTIGVTLTQYPDGSMLHAGGIVLVAHTNDGIENASVQLWVVQVPSGPVNVSALVGNGTATVSWSPPAGDGGSAITSYTVSSSSDLSNSSAVKAIIHPATDGWMFANGRWSATINGLVNGNTYTFYVFATNAMGTSQPTSSNAITLGTVPGAVRNLAVSAGDGSISATWDTPAGNGGLPILTYRITAIDGVHAPIVMTVTGTSATLTGLLNGTSYVVTINAVNTLGAGGPASAVATPRNLAPTIAAPSALTVHHGDVVNATVTASGPELSDHLVLTASGLPTGVTFTDKGNGTGVLAGNAQVPAGTYPLTFTVNDSHNATVSQSTTLTVTREQADVRLFATAPLSVMLKNAAQTQAKSLTIRSTVREVTDPNGYADIGEAADVTYTLTSVQTGATYSGKAATVGGGVEGTLITKYTFRNVPRGVYELRISVGGNYYQGTAEAMVAVSGPAVHGGVTGSGQVVVPANNAGAHFQFQAHRQANGKLSGSLLYVEQRAGITYTFQSRSITALVFKGHTAYIQGMGTLNGVGKHQFVATVVDKHHQARIDRFGLRVIDRNFVTVNHCTFAPVDLASGKARITHG